MGQDKVKIHVLIDRDVYHKLWELILVRYLKPARKLSEVVNEALKEYIEKNLPPPVKELETLEEDEE